MSALKCFLVVSLMISSLLGAKLKGDDPPSSKPIYDLDDAESHFEIFMKFFGKQYPNDKEKNRRFEIFKGHLEDINRRNKDPNQSAVFGVTLFCDLTKEEFLKYYTGLKVDPLRNGSWGYRRKGIVPIRCHATPMSIQLKKVDARVAEDLRYCLTDADLTIQTLVENGPIAIGVDATDLQTYRGGVLTCKGYDLNHAVLLVGYGQEGDLPYYTIKNSWGTQWGENGYVRVDWDNPCGLYNTQAAGAVAA